MSKKLVKINVSSVYELEVDEENSIVQDYKDLSEIIDDLASYKFSDVLPVLKEGVKIQNFEIVGWSF
jgi:hypothetical protein